MELNGCHASQNFKQFTSEQHKYTINYTTVHAYSCILTTSH